MLEFLDCQGLGSVKEPGQDLFGQLDVIGILAKDSFQVLLVYVVDVCGQSFQGSKQVPSVVFLR